MIRFFLYSVAVHALLIAVLLFIVPAPEKKKAGGAFFTDLVSPEEFLAGKSPMLPPKPRARPLPPSRPKSVAPSRSITQPGKGTSYDHVKRSYGETKDTKAVLPSPPVITRGEGDSPMKSGQALKTAEISKNRRGSDPHPGRNSLTIKLPMPLQPAMPVRMKRTIRSLLTPKNIAS